MTYDRKYTNKCDNLKCSCNDNDNDINITEEFIHFLDLGIGNAKDATIHHHRIHYDKNGSKIFAIIISTRLLGRRDEIYIIAYKQLNEENKKWEIIEEMINWEGTKYYENRKESTIEFIKIAKKYFGEAFVSKMEKLIKIDS